MILKEVPLIQRVFWTLIAFAWIYSGIALAQPLEDISLQTETSRVVATIKLSSPVHNVRYSPTKKGSTLNILFEKLPAGTATDGWTDNEVLNSPPSNLIPSFTVKVNLKNIQPRLIIEFSREAEYTVQMGNDNRSILVGIHIDKVIPNTIGGLPFLPDVKPWSLHRTPSAPADSATDPNINKQASELMLRGRNALAGSDNFAAIDAFNKLLLLPPNDYTRDAQEWVGVARERAGQPGKAKLEYELYLKLYPDGEDAEQVKQRLSKLTAPPPQAPSAANEVAAQKKRPSQSLAYGSLSMHYYRGATKIDTADTVSQLGAPLAQSTFSAIDQSALLTSVDATQRFISEEYDNRIVFRDTAYSNFLPGQTPTNRMSSAYFEIKNRLSDYSARIGRQSSSGAGVMGRFDGAALGFGATPSLRINAVAGQISDYMFGTKPVFFGASMDMGPVTVYAINQTVDGVLDRRAIGTEIRYFEPSKTAFVLLDYDTVYTTINTAMFQGTLSESSERTYNLLLDHRRAPYMSTRNALIGATTTSITDLLQLMTEDELRALAAARTGASNLAQVGVTQQISEKWQLGGDVRVSNYEGLPASGLPDLAIDPTGNTPSITGLLQATPKSGNEWAVTPQLIGSNLFSNRDVTIFSLSYLTGKTYKGQSFYVYSRSYLTDKWSLDVSLQYFRQNFSSGVLMTRTMPMLRTAYQIRQTLSLDMDAGVEISHSEGTTQISNGRRQFYSLGFRWDF